MYSFHGMYSTMVQRHGTSTFCHSKKTKVLCCVGHNGEKSRSQRMRTRSKPLFLSLAKSVDDSRSFVVFVLVLVLNGVVFKLWKLEVLLTKLPICLLNIQRVSEIDGVKCVEWFYSVSWSGTRLRLWGCETFVYHPSYLIINSGLKVSSKFNIILVYFVNIEARKVNWSRSGSISCSFEVVISWHMLRGQERCLDTKSVLEFRIML